MSPITRSDELRYANRARVLACLRSSGSQSRKQIASSTRLSAATVTQVTAQLLDEQIIVESDQPPLTTAETRISPLPLQAEHTGDSNNQTPAPQLPRRGRPQVVLELTPQAAVVAIVTVNFDRIEVTLFDYSGSALTRHTNAIKPAGKPGNSLLEQITDTLQQALRPPLLETSSLQHITVACQGKVSRHDGDLLWSPRSQDEIIAVGRHLRARFGVDVTVDNDCNMIASALYDDRVPGHQQDSGGSLTDGTGNFAAVLVSYGIGLGLIHDGAILTGSRSSGTELGHMQISTDGPLCRCGSHGCIEAYAADYAIWRRVNGLRPEELAEETIPAEVMHEIFTAAQATDGIERLALREAGAAIGQGLANLFAIFDSFPIRLVGLDQTAASFVAEAIHQRLPNSGDSGAEDIVSVHCGESENELIRRGAAMQCLAYVDQHIFSVGSPANVINN